MISIVAGFRARRAVVARTHVRGASPASFLPSLLVAGALLLSSPLTVSRCHAQGGPAEAVAAGAAVAGVVVEVIGGLSNWVNDQTDDCAAASLGAAWGKDCNLNQEEDNDTGWSSVFVVSDGDNSCARGHGQALAQEGLLGSWSSCTVKPWVIGWTRPLHPGCGDTHSFKAWAKASVDGKSKAKTESSPGAAPFRLDTDAPTPQAAWPPGTVLVVATIDDLTLEAASFKPNAGVFTARLKINGQPRWSVTARMDKSGRVTTTGPLDPRQFSIKLDRATGKYTAKLVNYRHEIPVDTLAFAGMAPGVAGLAADGDTETEVSVSMEAEMDASGDNGNGGVCQLPVDATCMDLYTTNSDGTYVHLGEHLNLGNVQISSVDGTYPVLAMTVRDVTGAARIVDPFHPAGYWHAGGVVHLTGYLALMDGEPVLTNVNVTSAHEIDPVPIDPKPIVDGDGGRGRDDVPTLDQNEPNPFNPVTGIAFTLTRPGPVTLDIFGIDGRLVRRLVDGSRDAGRHEVLWDGRAEGGAPVSSGVYFYRLETAGRSLVRRMIMTK